VVADLGRAEREKAGAKMDSRKVRAIRGATVVDVGLRRECWLRWKGRGLFMENVQNVASAIIDELGPMDAMKLQKLLYYSQAWSLAVTDKPMFADEVQAWRDGPVVPNVYKHHKQLRKVRDWQYGNGVELSKESLSLVRLVCGQYGHQSGDELSDLTHCESPWMDARGSLPPEASSRERIPVEGMARYYRRSRTLGGRRAADLAAGGLVSVQQEETSQALHNFDGDFVQDHAPMLGFGHQSEHAPAPVLGFGQRIRVDRPRPSGFRPSRSRFGE
jgi:uncharacterized phage-associated protein